MGDVSYRPLIEDMTWSYSRIQCFNDCPYRFFLKYIKKIPEKPQFYSSFGSFMHRLIEEHYKNGLSYDDLALKFLTGYQKEVKGERPPNEAGAKHLKSGLEYFKTAEDFPYNTIGVEKKIYFNIGDSPFVGILDFIGEKNGEYSIVDNKSRNLKQRSRKGKHTAKDKELDEMLRQLLVYSEALKQEYGNYPKELCFNCFKNKEFIVEPFVQEAHDEAIRWAEDSIERIKDADEFPPFIEWFSCKYICGVSDDCCYWEVMSNKNRRY